MKKLLSVIVFVVFAFSCTAMRAACHKHTYDESKWEKDDTYHWHPTKCEHTDVVEKVEHDVNEFNKCTVCGWQGKLPYERVSSEIWEATFENFYNLRNFTITYTQFDEGKTTFNRLVEVTETSIHWLQIEDGNREEMYAKVEGNVATVYELNDGIFSAASETFNYDEWVEEQLEVFNVDDYSEKISENFEKFNFSEDKGGTYTYSVGKSAIPQNIPLYTYNARFVDNSLFYYGREFAIAHIDFDSGSMEIDEVLAFVILDKIGTTSLAAVF